ncbi:MAG: hypothetical protein K0U24_02670 [Gammaproteobacteria bacterium]|nr:hypothetical protein [Gammaproteobacteria bacterium]
MNFVRPAQIPEDIWLTVFNQQISDQNLALMHAAPSDLLRLLSEMTLSTPYEKAQAASAIAFGHPDIAPNELFTVLKNIEPTLNGQISLVHEILQVDALYLYIATEHALELTTMLNSANYSMLYMFTMHNAQPVIASIFELLSPAKQLEIIKARDYEIFQRAGAANNLLTMQYAVEKMTALEPDNLNEMLTIADNKVFDYAHHCERQDVINYLLSFDIIFNYVKADEEYQIAYAEHIAARAQPLLVTQLSMWQPVVEEDEEEEEEVNDNDKDSVNSYSSN